MVNPPQRELPVESQYKLAIAVAKRARQLVLEESPALARGVKPVTKALEEIMSGKIKIVSGGRRKENSDDEN